jgi:hypothetical protein
MARQLKILEDKTQKKRRLRLRDLASRKETKGGARKRAEHPKLPIPKSLEEFLRRDSLRID